MTARLPHGRNRAIAARSDHLGFTARATLPELIAIGRKFKIPVAEDLGSGLLLPGVRGEPVVSDSIAAGADVACFSGDKLLGGPQAGIVVGRADLLTAIRTHPLMRALRVDKMTYGALEATLAEYVAGRAATTVPVQRMLTMTVEEIRARADALAAAVAAMPGWQAQAIDGVSAVGGGSAPGVDLPTSLVAIEKRGLTPDALEERLRRATPAVIARIERERLVLDLRTVLADQDAELIDLLRRL